MSEKVLVIMRGVPGSGKSYTAHKVLEELGGGDPKSHIFSTDNFWIPTTIQLRAGGANVSAQAEKAEYTSTFDPNKLGFAHKTNYNNFVKAVDQGISPVIIDNTNVQRKAYQEYIDYAKKAGYQVRVQEPTSPWWQENSVYLKDKKRHAAELDNFAALLFTKNSHGVPQHAIRKMLDRWDIHR